MICETFVSMYILLHLLSIQKMENKVYVYAYKTAVPVLVVTNEKIKT